MAGWADETPFLGAAMPGCESAMPFWLTEMAFVPAAATFWGSAVTAEGEKVTAEGEKVASEEISGGAAAGPVVGRQGAKIEAKRECQKHHRAAMQACRNAFFLRQVSHAPA